MLNEKHRDRVEVVLVSPRNPLNIGAAARAMANFGFARLTVVAPYAPHWREARSAVGAPELLAHAREVSTVAEAVADCTLVLGTGSLEYRKPEQAVMAPPEAASAFHRELGSGGRVALIFGPEKHGLTREDLSYAHRLVVIPTDAHQPSMNLGQAVAVLLYELGARATSDPAPLENDEKLPISVDAASLERLAVLVEEVMAASGYSPRAMQQANHHDLRLMLRRLRLGPADARRALGLFRRILWRLAPRNPTAGADD